MISARLPCDGRGASLEGLPSADWSPLVPAVRAARRLGLRQVAPPGVSLVPQLVVAPDGRHSSALPIPLHYEDVAPSELPVEAIDPVPPAVSAGRAASLREKPRDVPLVCLSPIALEIDGRRTRLADQGAPETPREELPRPCTEIDVPAKIPMTSFGIVEWGVVAAGLVGLGALVGWAVVMPAWTSASAPSTRTQRAMMRSVRASTPQAIGSQRPTVTPALSAFQPEKAVPLVGKNPRAAP